MMVFTGAIFLLISLDSALSVSNHSKTITLSSSKEEVIKSPGYPHKNYPRNTNYTWYVIASDDTEEISINITMDIHEVLGFGCDDYLKIQDINSSGRKFDLFKKCGQLKVNRIAKGNRLLITLISNDDQFASKGFELTLKVSKVGTTSTTRTTSTQSTTTKTRTTASTVKTTVSTSTLLSSTTKPLHASTVEVLMSNTTTTTNTTTQPTTSTTPLTTRKMITTIPNMALTTNATKLLTKSRTSQTSTETASTIRTTDGNNPTIHLSQSPRNSYSSPIATESNKESTTIWLPSSQSVKTQNTSYQTSTSNTQTQPKQSSTSATRNNTTTMDQDSSSIWDIFESMERETVILLIGLGVLEVTLIVVGVLAVKRYRRKRNSNPSRQASKRIDDHTNTLKRQNSCGETNVYDEINIDDVKEEKEEENPYKELPEGVYDTTLKRRSYLKVVGEQISNYSRGSIINKFRTSSFFKRKVNETSVMTFSSFKGPIQSQIGEKNNQ